MQIEHLNYNIPLEFCEDKLYNRDISFYNTLLKVIDMDDKKLRAMLAVVRTGSFSRAAEEIGYTQSGMTQMMNSLENELGCPLFVRGFNGVTLTPEGKQLLPYIEDVNRSMNRLRDEIDLVNGGAQRPLRIGAYASISKNWLPPVIKAYRSEHPDVSIELRVGAEEIPDWLDANAIDLALVDDSRKRGYRWIPLHEEALMAVVPVSAEFDGRESVTLEELAAHPFIMAPLNQLKSSSGVMPDFSAHEKIMLDSADDAILLSLVEQGLGVTVLPELAIHGRDARVHTLPLNPPLRWELGLVLPKTVSNTVNEFVNFLLREKR